MDTKLYGALEAGGTKMVLGIADADGRILHSHSLPTRTPNETVPEMIAFFSQHAICALGVATFGPAQVHADSPEYGAILHTPKLAWQGYPPMPDAKPCAKRALCLRYRCKRRCVG